MKEVIDKYFQSHQQGLSLLKQNYQPLCQIIEVWIKALSMGKKIIFAGNGGSAADAQHLAAELLGRFKINRPSLAALSLTTNTSTLTAIANDFGYDQVFSKQLEALGAKGDVLVVLSTSGKSINLVESVKTAKSKEIKTIGFLGQDGGKLKPLVDLSLTITLNDTAAIQEIHIFAGHIVCAMVESHFFSKNSKT